MSLVLGVDAGGTSSRAAVFSLSGSALGRGTSGGGNPVALGLPGALANLEVAVRGSLAAVDPAAVKAVVVGLAGMGALRDPAARAAFDAAFAATGVGVAPSVVGDVVVAFAAGTAAPSGTVLIAGTGAIAAKIIDRQVAETADGFGWQLGDEGSGFWLGRAAARATIRALPAVAPGGLADLVLRELLPGPRGDDLVGPLAQAVQNAPPLALARLAPLVSRAAAAGDPVACSIVAEAARLLAGTVSQVRGPGERTPIVLAGSVLTSEGPVRRAVQDLLEGATVAGDGAGAAAWLAAREVLGSKAAPLHPLFAGR